MLRLDCVVLVVNDGGVHVLLVVIPVAGALPQLAVEDHRSGDLNVAIALVNLAPVVDERVLEDHAVGQEEREAGALLGQHEQTELLAELAVVALLRFFEHVKVLVKLVLLRERGAVDTLEHLLGGVTAPVSARNVHQLDAVALDTAGGVQMRTCAQVGEFALLVEGDRSVLGQVVDQLYLVRLLALLHELDSFLTRKLEALELFLLLADLAHLGLECVQMLLREGERCIEVVIEAVFDSRADGQLDLRVQTLYRLSEDVGNRVTVRVTVFLVFKRVLVVLRHGFISPFLSVLTKISVIRADKKIPLTAERETQG